ncbi:hypothetical protein BJY04DRAFT_204211 [Aspergillus karnatakaensis]|uniref:class I SAM-dependent methyltransferase n=1 Tax=Aspergillus karnatakaensis TaxID=1810916 RepID=UPI003CCE2988
MGDAGEIYPLGRDKAESLRLNEQHKLILDIVDGPIAPEVLLDSVQAVAEVATGTGIWLWEAQQLLKKSSGDVQPYFHGFDISSAQFPATPEGIELSIHDVLKPFPPEHHNRYDLVHLRLLLTAFGEAEFQTAVENLLPILKPGGYLQWVEISFTGLYDESIVHHPKAVPTIEAWTRYVDQNNISRNAPKAVRKAFETAGLVNVSDRSFMVRGREELNKRAQDWQTGFFTSVMPLVLLKTGQVGSQEEAKEKAAQIAKDLGTAFAEGEALDIRFGTVVGQKARE